MHPEAKTLLRSELLAAAEPSAAGLPAPRLYAILDASRDPAMIPPTLEALTPSCECLYRGEARDAFGDGAPWLVELRQSEDVMDWLFEEHVGKAHVSFFVSALDLRALAGHFRRFVKVAGERHDLVFYRFFDPVILNYHLPIFSVDQRRHLLSPIACVVAELGEREIFTLRLAPDGGIDFERLALPDPRATDAGAAASGGPPTATTPARETGRYPPPPLDMTGSRTKPFMAFSTEQHEAMRDAAAERSRMKIVGILREAEPRETFDMPDATLYRLVARSEETGRALGIRTESGLARWAYLMGLTKGRVATTPEAVDFIRAGGGDPDAQVRALLLDSAAALRAGTTIPDRLS